MKKFLTRNIPHCPQHHFSGRGKFAAFTEPNHERSRRRASVNESGFRCNCERWHLMRGAVPAFTLAEVLITLAIIGVVAAMTLPTLFNKINSKIIGNQKKVIEKKLIDGINLYNNLENGLSGIIYNNSKEFLEALSEHYKMTKICGADNLRGCIPYDTLIDDEEIVSVKTLGTNESVGLGTNYYAPSAFITADGVPFVFALKKNCVYDPDTPMKEITDSGCFAILYDINGSRGPNTIGKDIFGYGGMYPKGYFKKVNGVKIAEPAFFPKPLSLSECQDEARKDYGIRLFCSYEIDYWAGAMKYCHDNGWKLSSSAENESILSTLFLMNDGSYAPFSVIAKFQVEPAVALGFKNEDHSVITAQNHSFIVWSSGQGSGAAAAAYGAGAYWRRYNVKDRNQEAQAICTLNNE